VSSFLLHTSRRDGSVIVGLEGPVGISASKELSQALSCLAEESIDEVVVDLTAAELIDSAALGALVLAQKQARRRNTDLVLSGATGKTRRLLELTGLDRTFRLVTSTSDR